MARIVMLGRQGAGKGTQAGRLASRFGVPHISTGECFRTAVAAQTALGRRVEGYLAAGDLVPDELVIDVVAERLGERDAARGFILDGFPRTRDQAEALLGLLAPVTIDAAVEVDVPVEVVVDRMARRRVCPSCGAMTVAPHASLFAVRCRCGDAAVQRADDTPEAIRRRLALYEIETEPVIAFLRERGLLVPVDGLGPPEQVERRIMSAIGPRFATATLAAAAAAN